MKSSISRKENIEPYTNNKIEKLYKFLDECEAKSEYQASLTTAIDYQSQAFS
jgi:hypothetical protein